MQQAILLMVEVRFGGIESGHKDLRLDSFKLLVRNCIKEILVSVSYLVFFDLFEGFYMNVMYQMTRS